MKIGIIGEFKSNFRPHQVVQHLLNMANQKLDSNIQFEWIETIKLTDWTTIENIMGEYSGIWCSPGSPYRSTEGAINGIRFARERKIPFIASCGGFQHMIIESARNIWGFPDSDSENATTNFIVPFDCALTGQDLPINISKASLAYSIWQTPRIVEHYYCRFGINMKYMDIIQKSDFLISGIDDNNEPRIMELKDHPFFVGTLFVPGDKMLFDNFKQGSKGYPLIGAFLHAAAQQFIATE